MNSHQVSRARQYLGDVYAENTFLVQGFHLLWPDFPDSSDKYFHIRMLIQVRHDVPTTPYTQRPDLTRIWFGLLPFRSPLLR